jgi:hypothetical protein
MSSKARITSEFPSEQELVSRLKLSFRRAAQLRKQLHDLHADHPNGLTKVGAFQKASKPSRSRVAAKKG